MARSNVYGTMSSDANVNSISMGGRRNPSEISAWLNSDTGNHMDVGFTASLISSGDRRHNGLAMRKTCRTSDCKHKYDNDTTTRQCPECGVIRQGIDTRTVRLNLTLPFDGVAEADWSAWIAYDRSSDFNVGVRELEVKITDNPELDVALIAVALVPFVPDIHILGFSLRKLIAKELWMKAFYSESEKWMPTKIQHPSRSQVGVIDDPDEVLHSDYDKFDDNEDEYKGAF